MIGMELDRLPPRITGFFERNETPHSLDGKAFKSACHLVAQMDGGGTVENFDVDLLGRSYFAATLRTASDHLTVLCNGVHPYVAFTPPIAAGAPLSDLRFLAPTQIAALFSTYTEFQPLDADWLSAELHPKLLNDLGSAELAQVAYWKPQIVGEVIFNHWD